MNASQRRTFRRALSASLRIAPGDAVRRNGTDAVILRVSPNGSRTLEVKRRDNRRVIWPIAECAVRLRGVAPAGFNA